MIMDGKEERKLVTPYVNIRTRMKKVETTFIVCLLFINSFITYYCIYDFFHCLFLFFVFSQCFKVLYLMG